MAVASSIAMAVHAMIVNMFMVMVMGYHHYDLRYTLLQSMPCLKNHYGHRHQHQNSKASNANRSRIPVFQTSSTCKSYQTLHQHQEIKKQQQLLNMQHHAQTKHVPHTSPIYPRMAFFMSLSVRAIALLPNTTIEQRFNAHEHAGFDLRIVDALCGKPPSNTILRR